MGSLVSDGVTVVREFLTEASDFLTWLGGDPLYVSSPIAHPGTSNDRKAVIFHPEVETIPGGANAQEGTYVFKCYGGSASFTAAREVARKLRERLHNAHGVTSNGRIVLAQYLLGFQGPPDDETGWPVYICKYRIVTE